MFAGLSGLTLSGFIVVGYFIRAIIGESAYAAICLTSALWFLSNLLFTAWFFVKTFRMLDEKSREAIVFRFAIHEACELDVHRRIKHLLLGNAVHLKLIDNPDEKVMEIFEKDFEISKEGANLFIPEKNIHPTAFGIVIEMCFQLGLPRLQKFKRFHYHLNKCEYEESAAEMLDSIWAKKQTPNRAKALADKMKSI